MSKFILHPFDYQIRSAVRREATAVRKEPIISAIASLNTIDNIQVFFNRSLIALGDILDETGGTNPIEVLIEVLEGGPPSAVSQGIIAEPEVLFGFLINTTINLVATPSVEEEGSGGVDVELFILEGFNSQGSGGYNKGLTAEAEISVV